MLAVVRRPWVFVFGMAWAAAATAIDLKGWSTIPLPAAGTYALEYVPAGLDPTVPAPLVLFLHGSGSRPEAWVTHLSSAADAVGVVVVAPRSPGGTWEWPDDQAVLAGALAGAPARIAIDPRRTAIAGQSAGGAVAVLTAYGLLLGKRPHLSGAFILASPFAFVGALADPGYVAPLRQYYGVDDPNYQQGARDAMRAQWERLGVPFEEEIEPGFGHNTWPASTLPEGFAFLARQRYPAFSATCEPSATELCLDAGRFRASVHWRSASAEGEGRAVSIAAGDSGLFWFFGPDNIELLVKVLDGCPVNGRAWVFASATTDVEFTLRVVDTVTGAARSYSNPLGHAAAPIADTAAFASCP